MTGMKARNILSMDFDPYGYCVTFLKIFRFSNTRPDGHNVAAIFREHGSFPFGFADPGIDRYHSPAICHESQYGFQVAALFRWDGDEEPWSGSSPEPDFAFKFDFH